MSLEGWLRGQRDRCSLGFHLSHHPHLCACVELGDWSIFLAALREAVGRDGLVHQKHVRPRIRGRIRPNDIGSCYRKARTIGLLVEEDHERSNDREGRNAGRMEPVYRLHLEALNATTPA